MLRVYCLIIIQFHKLPLVVKNVNTTWCAGEKIRQKLMLFHRSGEKLLRQLIRIVVALPIGHDGEWRIIVPQRRRWIITLVAENSCSILLSLSLFLAYVRIPHSSAHQCNRSVCGRRDRNEMDHNNNHTRVLSMHPDKIIWQRECRRKSRAVNLMSTH